MQFKDRTDAGQQLVQALRGYRTDDMIVLALPRGGVPIGYEIARELKVPLDVLIVRKIGVPGHEELAMGAIGPDEMIVRNKEVICMLDIPLPEIDRVIRRETDELNRRMRQFRGERPFPDLTGKTVVIVDDGIATGATAMVAVQAVKAKHPAKVILAVPVCARNSASALRHEVDELVCLESPAEFYAVSLWYRDFGQTSDEEVMDLLQKAWKEIPNTPISSY